MDIEKTKQWLRELIDQTKDMEGRAAVERFPNLRAVDAKVREAKLLIREVEGIPEALIVDMDKDEGFQFNSRRVRLETLANYCVSALNFLEKNVYRKNKKIIFAAPDLTKLTSTMPGLAQVIKKRWLEAQRCQEAESFLAAVVMMGSILEALLLARANLRPAEAYRSTRVPKSKDGKQLALQDWTLNSLIDVAVELSWIKADRGKFGHALRESRNAVHPWTEVLLKIDFDMSTCKTSWEVLNASVDDLLNSI